MEFLRLKYSKTSSFSIHYISSMSNFCFFVSVCILFAFIFVIFFFLSTTLKILNENRKNNTFIFSVSICVYDSMSLDSFSSFAIVGEKSGGTPTLHYCFIRALFFSRVYKHIKSVTDNVHIHRIAYLVIEIKKRYK